VRSQRLLIRNKENFVEVKERFGLSGEKKIDLTDQRVIGDNNTTRGTTGRASKVVMERAIMVEINVLYF